MGPAPPVTKIVLHFTCPISRLLKAFKQSFSARSSTKNGHVAIVSRSSCPFHRPRGDQPLLRLRRRLVEIHGNHLHAGTFGLGRPRRRRGLGRFGVAPYKPDKIRFLFEFLRTHKVSDTPMPCAGEVNCPRFRPDSRHTQKGSSTGSRACVDACPVEIGGQLKLSALATSLLSCSLPSATHQRAGSGNLHRGDKWNFCLTSA